MSAFLESQLAGAGLALPTSRDEAWRHAPLKPLAARALAVGDVGAASRPVPDALLEGALAEARLVFVNGALRADLTGVSSLPGLALSHDRPFEAAAGADAFGRLNSALAPASAVVRVAAGVDAGTLHVRRIAVTAGADVATYAQLRIVLEEGARLELVERQCAADAHAQLSNVATLIEAAGGARLRLVRIQREADGATTLTRTHATLGAGAEVEHVALEAGGGFARHALEVVLAAPGASFEARGVFALRGRQHGETHLSILHAARDTRCDVLYRGLADGRARGVFVGAITMAPGADGADARLENKNLLLSPHAEIDTQPVLEIHADEVRASHGATVGQLDERALFYLRSRGVPEPEARVVLTRAFCAAPFDPLPAALRDALRGALDEALGDG